MKYKGIISGLLASPLITGGALAADHSKPDLAKLFGTREQIIDISIAPDGQHVAYVMPLQKGTGVIVSSRNIDDAKLVARADGKPFELTDCGWASSKRLLCNEYGLSEIHQVRAPFTRTVAVDMDGGNVRWLGRQQMNAARISQFDGEVIDWLSGDGNVLMMRDYVPVGGSSPFGPAASDQFDGMGVDRVDSTTGRATSIELPVRGATRYISDGQGNIRIVAVQETTADGDLSGRRVYRYRLPGQRSWRDFSRITPDDDSGLRPIAVDGTSNEAYALRRLDGRDALYRVKLDGTMKTDLVYANPDVDVAGVVTIGRSGRVIGASYVTDRRKIEYFDPGYRALAASLAKALPKLPLIYFVGASADEKQLLIFAGSDVDPGQYYVFDRTTRHLGEITRARPELDSITMAPVTSVTYPAADGKMVPAYLTLPPGSVGHHLPAIVMPHGGPASRDEWGFDWLAQYFAQRGFAVLQPEFRGSTGYGDGWYVDNGFKSWKVAIGDINDGAHWLQKQGIADADKLAIVGWSYGGYAALQANVVDPALFKAVVAIAPVTSLAMMKREAQSFTNKAVVDRFIGDGPHVKEGSPLEHPDAFKAPVLMFHGDHDINVGVAESRAMDKALRQAGKASRLVVYPGLDHQLNDDEARADMLRQADKFLRTSLHLAAATG